MHIGNSFLWRQYTITEYYLWVHLHFPANERFSHSSIMGFFFHIGNIYYVYGTRWSCVNKTSNQNQAEIVLKKTSNCNYDFYLFYFRQPCSIMTSDVIEAVCQCLLAQAADAESLGGGGAARQVLEEFAHCLQDIIGAAQHTKPTQVPSNVL